MKKLLPMLLWIYLLAVPVSAMEFIAPEAPLSAEELMPEDTSSFSGALAQLIRKAGSLLIPDLMQALESCSGLVGVVLLTALVSAAGGNIKVSGELAGALGITTLLFHNTGAMIRLAGHTVQELNAYGKMLLPVMTGALAAQGGITASTGLYIGTAFFSTVLESLLSSVFIPFIYIYLAFALSFAAVGEEFLNRIAAMIKGSISWCLKTMLTVFVSYMSITGVISGTTDVAALKAAKVTISSVVPVVGGILSDASESILVSAALMKNAAGIYGILAVLALFLGPFVKIGAHYLALKGTALICGIVGPKPTSALIGDFCTAMGLLLALISSMCLLILISTVCFLKGAGV